MADFCLFNLSETSCLKQWVKNNNSKKWGGGGEAGGASSPLVRSRVKNIPGLLNCTEVIVKGAVDDATGGLGTVGTAGNGTE